MIHSASMPGLHFPLQPSFRHSSHKEHSPTLAELRRDIEQFEAWYETVSRNKTEEAGRRYDGESAYIANDTVSKLLTDLGLTQQDVKHLLGMTHNLEEVLKYYTKKDGRIRRSADGKK